VGGAHVVNREDAVVVSINAYCCTIEQVGWCAIVLRVIDYYDRNSIWEVR